MRLRGAVLRGMCIIALGCAVAAQAAEVPAALQASRQRIQAADYRVSGHMVFIDDHGARTNLNVTIKAHWFPGVLRVLVDLGQPHDVHSEMRKHILLEMRPDGQNTIHVAAPGDAAPATVPFEKWSDSSLGPGFSYEDFLEQQYFWPEQTSLPDAKFGARDCNVVKSTPDPRDRTHYAEVKTWLDHTIGFPVYAEKTSKGSATVKEFTYYGVRHDEGVWSAHQIEAKKRGSTASTLLIIDHGSAKANLTLADFSAEQLTHFQN